MNNFEKIKAMSTDKLAKIIVDNANDTVICQCCIHKGKCKVNTSCLKGIKLWLETESEDAECQK